MPKLYYRVALPLLFACVIIASAGTGKASAEPSHSSLETNEAPAEANSAAAGVSVTPGPGDAICSMIEAAARANSIPADFFMRVIWQESRFRSDDVGPVTRSGQRAQGIAQFMPVTAAERGLLDPSNPIEALPKSGKFLAELRVQFGNLGLAAAAYNAGPQRVRHFIAGLRGLPRETHNYVRAVTGRPIEYWADLPQAKATEGVEMRPQTDLGTEPCSDLAAKSKRAPVQVFVQRDPRAQFGRAPHFAEQQRSVPSWCQHLHHPKVSVCGSVHQ